jgi:hypothetical protein
MFPELDVTDADLSETEDTSIPWTYKIDWETRQLMRGLDGRYLRTESYAEYLAEVAQKILNTKRFAYAIYSENYGVDFLAEIGRMRPSISLAVIRQQAQEALEAHSEIESAEVIDIRFEQNKILFSLELEGVRGKTKAEVTAWKR